MRLTAKTLFPAVFLALLAGCASYTSQVDLNNDSRLDTVSGVHTEGHWFYADYRLTQRISQPDGTHLERSLIQFRGKPDELWFEDLDGDGDLDLRATLSSKTRWDYIVDGEYVALNDGHGNFGELELVDGATRAVGAGR
jgi:hypothetical protein